MTRIVATDADMAIEIAAESAWERLLSLTGEGSRATAYEVGMHLGDRGYRISVLECRPYMLTYPWWSIDKPTSQAFRYTERFEHVGQPGWEGKEDDLAAELADPKSFYM